MTLGPQSFFRVQPTFDETVGKTRTESSSDAVASLCLTGSQRLVTLPRGVLNNQRGL